MEIRRLIVLKTTAIILVSLLLCSCAMVELLGYALPKRQMGYAIDKKDIKIFKKTEAWKLAIAVEKQDVEKIEKIATDSPELLNSADPFYGVTLLMWSVGMEKYNSAEALLKCGADPNIVADDRGMAIYMPQAEAAVAKNDLEWLHMAPQPSPGTTALCIASGFSWIDTYGKKDPKFVNLLLSYGADPTIYGKVGVKYFTLLNGRKKPYGTEFGMTPLLISVGSGLEKTKALVQAGADINKKTESGMTAAINSLQANYIREPKWGYAYFLIVENKAIVSEPYYTSKYMLANLPASDPDDAKTFYPVDLLREWVYDLDSEEHKIKMEIVEEFTRQGVDYWSTEIPESTLAGIKKQYPDRWEEYIKRY